MPGARGRPRTRPSGELIATEAADWQIPKLEGKALVHFHCHQRATSDIDCDRRVLDRLGVDYEVLQDGCCGLAGSFGYEPGEPYEVSVKAGERVLLPRVRGARPDTALVTDGFSCRSQISRGASAVRCTWLSCCSSRCAALLPRRPAGVSSS